LKLKYWSKISSLLIRNWSKNESCIMTFDWTPSQKNCLTEISINLNTNSDFYILHLTIFYSYISTFIPYLQTSLYLPLITQSSKTSVLFWPELTWVSKHSFSISDFLPHLDVFRSQASKKDHDSLIHRIDFCLLIGN